MNFTHIVVTAPTDRIASVYRIQLQSIQDTLAFLKNVNICCVSDPNGYRVGSGGGTWNALTELQNKVQEIDWKNAKILIIHSGGDSKRAPTYSLVGKAWTTLNGAIGDKDCGFLILTPITLLIQELNWFCKSLLTSSIVVASSDVLLDIAKNHNGPASFADNLISIVAVNEIPSVAKNHGVLVGLAEMNRIDACIQCPATLYTQKPSLESMKNQGMLYQNLKDKIVQDCKLDDNSIALVDTGVVIFTGMAYQAMIDLMTDPIIQKCTKVKPTSTLQSHEKLRLELYSDVLLAAAFDNKEAFELKDYYERLQYRPPDDQNIYQTALITLWNAFNEIPLQLIYVPDGHFEHMGTTLEVLHMLSSCLPTPTSLQAPFNYRHQMFAEKYQLQQVVRSAIVSNPIPPRAILINSCYMNDQSQLESFTTSSGDILIEHSMILDKGLCDQEGSVNVLSHLSPYVTKHCTFRNGIMAQQVYLHDTTHPSVANETEIHSSSFLILMLNVHDDVKVQCKPSGSICGATWNALLHELGMVSFDGIWDESNLDRSIWTAKLYPICKYNLETNDLLIQIHDEFVAINGLLNTVNLSSSQKASFLVCSWLQYIDYFVAKLTSHIPMDSNPVQPIASQREDFLQLIDIDVLKNVIMIWKSSTRLSLSDVLQHGDALKMFRWRQMMECVVKMEHVSDMIVNRKDVKVESYQVSQVFSVVLECTDQLSHISSDLVIAIILAVCCMDQVSPIQSQDMIFLSADKVVKLHPMKAALIQSFIIHYIDDAIVADQTIENVYEVFCQRFARLIKYDVDLSTWRLLLSYLKELCPVAYLRNVLTIVLQFSRTDIVQAESHPKVLLVCSWLVKGTALDTILMQNMSLSTSLTISTGGKLINRIPPFNDWEVSSIQQHGKNILSEVEEWFGVSIDSENSIKSDSLISNEFETAAQHMIQCQIQCSLSNNVFESPLPYTPRTNIIAMALCPVRIDLAGGWSDTPPICYDASGSVLNVAVCVDQKYPIRCAARMIQEPLLILKTYRIRNQTENISATTSDKLDHFEVEEVAITSIDEVKDLQNMESPCALIKAVLKVLGVIDSSSKEPLTSRLRRIFGMEYSGLEVVCLSELPAGSGMGGSSVLAAAVVMAVSDVLGKPLTSDLNQVVNYVSHVEQVLTTGGGWQDQVGAIFGGFKLGNSKAKLPLHVNVKVIPTSTKFQKELEKRTYLIYTGKQRLAKNTLINALRKYAITPKFIGTKDLISGKSTVLRLIEGASTGCQILTAAVLESQHSAVEIDDCIEKLAAVLNEYWELKKEMASGSEPSNISSILSQLRPLSVGLSLCGAGAGGYACMIVKKGIDQNAVQQVIHQYNASDAGIQSPISLHTITIANSGILVREYLQSDHSFDKILFNPNY